MLDTSYIELKVGGDNGVNIIGYIAANGLKISENDIDSPTAGRTLDGMMHRGKVTSKYKLEFKLVPMTREFRDAIFRQLRSEYVLVHYENNYTGASWTYTMYNTTRSSSLAYINSDGIEIYDDISFNLIQR